MSIDERSASRAEARRRARLAARGEPAEPEPADPGPEEQRSGGGFLGRLFPAAPPLPNRPDPLAGFSGSGPLRFVSERLFLLRRNPLAWVVPGIIAVVGYLTSFGGNGVIGLIGTFVLFGSLIAAGWFGWQRPALFGVAAALLGFVIAVVFVLVSFAQLGADPGTFGMSQLISQVVQGLYMGALGFLGGWYGGYLRRRQSQLSAAHAPRHRRR